jgi:hypothetical protein
MGDLESAKKALAGALKIDPNYNLSGFIRKFPYKDKEDLERYIDALKRIGLPE